MVRLWIELEGKSVMGAKKKGLTSREGSSGGRVGLARLWIRLGHRRGGLVSCSARAGQLGMR